MSRMSNNRLI
ncbi:uncharacterized protein FFMR_03868 [Fusarium fujikuroi]|nr:uncharacterized protein FFMR_03868 [Fusarium fujikuroi]